MSGNEVAILLGFLAISASLVFLWYIKKKRDGYFSDLSQRELGAMEQYSTIIYILFLTFISGILLIEIMLVRGKGMESITGLYRFDVCCGEPNNVTVLIWPYIGLCFTVMCFTLFAAYNEILLSQRMIHARRKLLLGQLPEENEFSDSSVTPTSSPMSSLSGVESNEPATFAAVLQAMDLQLKQVEKDAEDLKSELKETKKKVVTLEIEVKERDSQIKQIKESKSHFDKMIQERSQSIDEVTGKSLSFTDSVMVGDSVMGGVKIDKQINNDPEAIARAVIDAYRMGQNDK